ncbi:MAG: YncE family protein [Opitutus sp.]
MPLNIAGAVLFCTLAVIPAVAVEQPALQHGPTTALAGVVGRFDHFAVDLKTQRMFVAALGNDTVEVIDVAANKRLQTIRDVRKPQGVAYLAAQNQIVVASGADGTVKFFNGASYEIEHTLTGLNDADNVRFDPHTSFLYVGFGDGALAEIDAITTRQTAIIPLAGHPESFQLEQHGSRIFVNVPDARHLAVVDRTTHRVIATWPMNDVRANFPLALDEANHRLFVGCRQPSRLVVFDTESGRRVADLAISGDTDDLFYDNTRKRIYVSCGAGFVDVIDQVDANRYTARERIPTSAGARTSTFVSELRHLFIAVPHTGNQDAEIRSYQVQ